MRSAILQLKPRKGAYAQNLEAVGAAFAQLVTEPPDLVVLPEAACTGYFLEGGVAELALSAPTFARDLARTWREAGGVTPVDLVSGFYEEDAGTYYNSALSLRVERADERIQHVHRKMFLPTYGVFDEARFLSRGRSLESFETRFGRVALLICEDAWHSLMPTIAALKGAQILIVPSAAPGRGIEGEGELRSIARWRELLRVTAAEHGVYVLYAGLTGFEGGKGMTGSSCFIDPHGALVVQASATDACILRADLDLGEIARARARLPLLGDLQAVLPDLLLDAELPLPRPVGDARHR